MSKVIPFLEKSPKCILDPENETYYIPGPKMKEAIKNMTKENSFMLPNIYFDYLREGIITRDEFDVLTTIAAFQQDRRKNFTANIQNLREFFKKRSFEGINEKKLDAIIKNLTKIKLMDKNFTLSDFDYDLIKK